MKPGPGIIIFWIIFLGLIGWGIGWLAGGGLMGLGIGAALGLLLGIRRWRVRSRDE